MLNEEQVKGNINSTERQLMYDIRELLKEVLFYLKPKEEIKPVGVPCKFCGGTHKNRQVVAACAKKKKKESENNVNS
jgi:hypothetical protein